MARFVFKVFVVFCVCSVALFAAKAPEDKCYFPPYKYNEENFCDSEEEKCKKAKLESGYDEWIATLEGLLDNVNVEVYGGAPISENESYTSEGEIKIKEDKIKNITIDFSGYLIGTLSLASSDGLREATECNGKSCTTKGYNDKGKLIFEANCISGVNHGKQRLYDGYGNLEMELNFNKGKLEGRQNLGAKPDKNSDINIVEIKNGKLSGKIKLHDYRFVRHFGYDIEVDYPQDLSGEFKNGKPISEINISNVENLDYYRGVTLNENSYASIPFDKNSIINGEGIRYTYEHSVGCYYYPTEYGYDCALTDDKPKNSIKYSYKNNKLVSFKYINTSELIDCDSKCDIVEITDAVFEKIRQIDILTNSNIIDIYMTNKDDIEKDKYRYGEPYYKSGNFNTQGQKTGQWIEKKVIRFENGIVDYISATQTLESNYENDELNGAQKEWLNGKLIKETMYENDMLNGTLKEWDNNGNLIKAEIYKNGNRVQIIR